MPTPCPGHLTAFERRVKTENMSCHWQVLLISHKPADLTSQSMSMQVGLPGFFAGTCAVSADILRLAPAVFTSSSTTQLSPAWWTVIVKFISSKNNNELWTSTIHSNDSTRSALPSSVVVSFQNLCVLKGMSGISLLLMAVFFAVRIVRCPSQSSVSVIFSRNVFFR